MSALPLSTGEIVQMRSDLGTHLAGTAIIHTATKVADAQGGYVWTYAAASTVDARLAPHERDEGDEEILAERLAERQPYTLTVPDTASIDEDDRIVYNSITYEVVSARADVATPWDLCQRVVVARVD